MNTPSQFLEALLGLGIEPKELTFLQISLRGVIIETHEHKGDFKEW